MISTNYKILFKKLITEWEQSKSQRYFISIAGCSRSGKTSLAKRLKEDLEKLAIDSIIISLDNWLLGVDERDGTETVRERFQYKKITEDLTKLKNGEKIYSRVYHPKSRKIIRDKSIKSLKIESGGIGIIDGIVALDIKELRELSDYKIYVEIDDKIRKKRLIDFYVNYKNYSLNEAKKIIEPREKEEVIMIKKTKKYADFKMIFT